MRQSQAQSDLPQGGFSILNNHVKGLVRTPPHPSLFTENRVNLIVTARSPIVRGNAGVCLLLGFLKFGRVTFDLYRSYFAPVLDSLP